MRISSVLWTFISFLVLTGCSSVYSTGSSTNGTCPDLTRVANAFYAANDASQLVPGLSYLTEDVILVFWAEGINGHHMGQKVVIGKDQIMDQLNGPGLRLKATGPDLPNFQMDSIRQSGKTLIFHLTPDRTHADGRPYDPYVVEMVFSGCRIEIIKIVERITWV